jgi:hypothetical protein
MACEERPVSQEQVPEEARMYMAALCHALIGRLQNLLARSQVQGPGLERRGPSRA